MCCAFQLKRKLQWRFWMLEWIGRVFWELFLILCTSNCNNIVFPFAGFCSASKIRLSMAILSQETELSQMILLWVKHFWDLLLASLGKIHSSVIILFFMVVTCRVYISIGYLSQAQCPFWIQLLETTCNLDSLLMKRLSFVCSYIVFV